MSLIIKDSKYVNAINHCKSTMYFKDIKDAKDVNILKISRMPGKARISIYRGCQEYLKYIKDIE